MKGGEDLNVESRYILQMYNNDREQGLEFLVDKYKDSLYKFSLHLCKNSNEAEDLFQDTWIKVFKNINTFDENKNFQTWLFTICMNSYKDRYRKSKRWLNIIRDYFDNEEKQEEMGKVYSTENLPEEETIKDYEKYMIKKAVKTLKDEYRIPLILYYFQQLSYKEISEILSIPEGTIKSRLNKGRKLIKDYMEVNHYDG